MVGEKQRRDDGMEHRLPPKYWSMYVSRAVLGEGDFDVDVEVEEGVPWLSTAILIGEGPAVVGSRIRRASVVDECFISRTTRP